MCDDDVYCYSSVPELMNDAPSPPDTPPLEATSTPRDAWFTLDRVSCARDDADAEYGEEADIDAAKLVRPSCRLFPEEDEEEDDLPPLDEWYQAVIRRTEHTQ
jgi:hypothetical protein